LDCKEGDAFGCEPLHLLLTRSKTDSDWSFDIVKKEFFRE
jgi:hypothetical protein